MEAISQNPKHACVDYKQVLSFSLTVDTVDTSNACMCVYIYIFFFDMNSNEGRPSVTCIKMPVGCNSADENSKQQKCHRGYLPLAQSKHEGLVCALGWTFGPYSERCLMSYNCLRPSAPLLLSFVFPSLFLLFMRKRTHFT